MFENLGSLRGSGGRRSAALRLEALEDRTTPAAVATTGTNAVALDIANLAQSPYLDEAFLAESARLDLVQAYLGMVEVKQGADADIRAFGQQLLTDQLSALNQITPTLARVGISIPLASFDQLVGQVYPTLSGSNIDGLFLALSTMNTFQSAALDRTEATISSNSVAVGFAQAQLVVAQQEELTEFTLLGATGVASTANLFDALGGFSVTTGVGSPATTGFGAIGSPGATGFGTIGLNSTGVFGTTNTTGLVATSASTPASTTAVASGQINSGSATGIATAGGVGTGAPFGSENGFGPGAPFGSENGFGPGAPFA